jgi:hypothetical protein
MEPLDLCLSIRNGKGHAREMITGYDEEPTRIVHFDLADTPTSCREYGSHEGVYPGL